MNSIFKVTSIAMLAVMLTSAPLAVVKTKSHLGSGKVQITWTAEEPAKEYKLYRGTKLNGRYQVIKTVKGNGPLKFVDSNRKVGSTYYYKVSNGHGTSIPAKVKVKGGLREDPKNPLMLVNKSNWLATSYVPTGLTSLGSYALSDIKAKKEVKSAYGKLFAAAKKRGYNIKILSAYRSYHLQKDLFAYWTRVDGLKQALRTSAKAGRSEHQTGYALDVSCARAHWDLTEKFGATPEGKWLAKNAHKYGFIIRYGKNTEKITGYAYEPWHIRYVGTKAAGEIYKSNITLEEYLDY